MFSLIFTTGVGWMSRASVPYRFAVLHLLGIVGAASICWVLGGVIGIGLASLAPRATDILFENDQTHWGRCLVPLFPGRFPGKFHLIGGFARQIVAVEFGNDMEAHVDARRNAGGADDVAAFHEDATAVYGGLRCIFLE